MFSDLGEDNCISWNVCCTESDRSWLARKHLDIACWCGVENKSSSLCFCIWPLLSFWGFFLQTAFVLTHEVFPLCFFPLSSLGVSGRERLGGHLMVRCSQSTTYAYSFKNAEFLKKCGKKKKIKKKKPELEGGEPCWVLALQTWLWREWYCVSRHQKNKLQINSRKAVNWRLESFLPNQVTSCSPTLEAYYHYTEIPNRAKVWATRLSTGAAIMALASSVLPRCS